MAAGAQDTRSAQAPAAPSAIPRVQAIAIAPEVQRYALVIGNAKYQHLPPLDTPPADANDVCAAVARLGFHTRCLLDVPGKAELRQAIEEFVEPIPRDAAVLFYFAGHGVKAQGNDFLLPVDARIRDLSDVEFEGVRVDYLLQKLGTAVPRPLVLIIDACRDSPVPRLAGAGLPGGWGEGAAPPESIVVFSTTSSHPAIDGLQERNSPFAKHLLANLATPRLEIEQMLRRVIGGVIRETAGRQTPRVHTSFTGVFCFAACQEQWELYRDLAQGQSQIESEIRSTDRSYAEVLRRAVERSGGEGAGRARVLVAQASVLGVETVARAVSSLVPIGEPEASEMRLIEAQLQTLRDQLRRTRERLRVLRPER